MQPIRLPPKFDSQIINNKNTPEQTELLASLNTIFQNAKQRNSNPGELLSASNGFRALDHKPHVVIHSDLPNWIIKADRNDDHRFCADQNVYRVRHARRLQGLIQKHGMTEVVVPNKFLYHFENNWYVIAQKLELLDKPSSLTPKMVKELTILTYEGKLEDMGIGNLPETKAGKKALIDTEPVARQARQVHKQMAKKRNIISFKMSYMGGAFELINTMVQAERLYTICVSAETKETLRTVQRTYHLKYLLPIVAKTTLPLIAAIALRHKANTYWSRAGLSLIILSTANFVLGIRALGLLTFNLLYIRSDAFKYQMAVRIN